MAGNVREVSLRWTGSGLSFEGGPEGGVQIGVDGDSTAGQSPMQLLLMSVGACMAIDVLMILQKGRVQIDSLEILARGVRAEKPPKRYESIELVYRLSGPGPEDQAKVDRAIELSRDRYCSVLHTLDAGIEYDIRSELV